MRDVIAWMFIGLNGKGKTTLLIEYIKRYKLAKPKNSVVVFDQNESIPEYLMTKRLTIKNYKELLTNSRDTLFVVDDYKMLFDGNSPEEFWHDYFGTRRKRNNDIIFTCHSPNQVMNYLAGYIDTYLLWYTQTAVPFDKKIPCAKLLMEAKQVVDKYAKQFSDEQYMKLYPNFPYAIIRPMSEKITYYNFKKKKK